MENPCKTCEFLYQDKNREECKDCRDRIGYVSNLGGNAYEKRRVPVKPTTPETCTVPGCSGKRIARGLCRPHYDRLFGKSAKQPTRSKKITAIALSAISKGGKTVMKEDAESTRKPNESAFLVIDMSTIPGADEILQKIDEIGKTEMRPMEYQAAKILQDPALSVNYRIVAATAWRG